MLRGFTMEIGCDGQPYYDGGLIEIVPSPDGRWVARAVLQFARRNGLGKAEFFTRPIAGMVGIADTPDAALLALREYQNTAHPTSNAKEKAT